MLDGYYNMKNTIYLSNLHYQLTNTMLHHRTRDRTTRTSREMCILRIILTALRRNPNGWPDRPDRASQEHGKER